MPIEKVFAIHAAPEAIFSALEEELRDADAEGTSTFEVLERERARRLLLRVEMGGVPCRLTYLLTPRDEHTEVSAMLEPSGWRYAVFRIMTFSMNQQGFEIALVEGLANLKAQVEGGATD